MPTFCLRVALSSLQSGGLRFVARPRAVIVVLLRCACPLFTCLCSQLWLNEGFATWAGWLAVDDKFPEWQTWDQFLSSEGYTAFTADAMLSSHPIEIPFHDPKLINQARKHTGED